MPLPTPAWHAGVDTSFPVNAICYHPTWGTFATGGCDGVVNVWDGAKKKRVCQFSRYSTSLSALDFSPDGTHLAIAASYTFECGDKQHPPDAIYLRRVVDADVRPKQRKSTS
jgi:cell cycle arrest protein BUB3